MSTDDHTFLRKRGIKKRMRCDGGTASRIEDTFVTVEQLVDAVESDEPLTNYDGIGPKTAETIREWWDHRFEVEEQMGGGELEKTGAKTATIHFHESWEDTLREASCSGGNDAE
jgi:hypothetical protein